MNKLFRFINILFTNPVARFDKNLDKALEKCRYHNLEPKQLLINQKTFKTLKNENMFIPKDKSFSGRAKYRGIDLYIRNDLKDFYFVIR